ncbi:uncharacterized protein MELLADRAFT_111625 [Melampsora larici-populina 98AG31]|uniref:Hikeshi-like N-terminal domain-containing protein n=1 Tax=Melampsora larici-populina (strain 98AG31 / pathotype 3-4-7) TaxID=747676 RepID=F4S3T5_MELLP|nr:uncharacterized protein MELLADRAFT_111625 [Melampsora larici-populina 98AG31]EGG00741.1 hypothetical protein MELLADRAFT_111625 [Melampsora larici-populina 98AG31]
MDSTPIPTPPPMFACIIPSRPIQTQSTAIPPDKIIFEFEEASLINHLVVFLTGAIPFPEGYGASVHFLFPNQSEWKLLGMLSEEKPSAIFKLKGNQRSNFNHQLTSTSNSSIPQDHTKASLGFQILPLEQLQTECQSLPNQLIKLSSLSTSNGWIHQTGLNSDSIELIKSLGLSIFNYLASFSTTIPGINGQWINFVHLEKWWKTFQNQSSLVLKA